MIFNTVVIANNELNNCNVIVVIIKKYLSLLLNIKLLSLLLNII